MKRPSLAKIFAALLVIIVLLAIIPFGDNTPVQYIDRESGELKTEKIAGEGWLRWLYNNPIGEVSTATLVKRKFLSDWYGKQMDKPESKEKVAPFVQEYDIDLSIAQKQEFESFNEFFYRKLKPDARIINRDSNIIVSPADGKLLAFTNIKDQDFIVKGYRFNVNEYFQNEELAKRYQEGSLMIIRLCPTDYHRYHFPVDGTILSEKMIDGDYYSVSPIALKKKIELISLNKRGYCEIETQDFGKVIMSEVAATMVGTMINTYKDKEIEKGEERGYFKFGGSTVILFFEKGSIIIDADLLNNTAKGLETEVKMGTRIAIH
jgi:phosphatidylserine decarboxylase